jgi:peptide/nickel transport system permease protein
MIVYIVRRALAAVTSILLVSILVFTAVLAIPGDPAEIILGLNAHPEALSALREKLGLTTPPFTRFFQWLGGVVTGNLGESLTYQKSVASLINDRLHVSLPLAIGGLMVAILISIPLGIFAARKHGTLLDPLLTTLSQLGAAIPSFWLGLMLILLFAVELRWLPAGGYLPWNRDPLGTLRSLVLPILALGLGQAAVMTRMTRAAMLDILGRDFVRTARAKGLPEIRTLRFHAFRNALIPIVTIVGLSLTNILIGSIIIEEVFALPGLGKLALTAIGTRDYPLIQGEILVYASATVILSFLVDISYGLLDPRIRYS